MKRNVEEEIVKTHQKIFSLNFNWIERRDQLIIEALWKGGYIKTKQLSDDDKIFLKKRMTIVEYATGSNTPYSGCLFVDLGMSSEVRIAQWSDDLQYFKSLI